MRPHKGAPLNSYRRHVVWNGGKRVDVGAGEQRGLSSSERIGLGGHQKGIKELPSEDKDQIYHF